MAKPPKIHPEVLYQGEIEVYSKAINGLGAALANRGPELSEDNRVILTAAMGVMGNLTNQASVDLIQEINKRYKVMN